MKKQQQRTSGKIRLCTTYGVAIAALIGAGASLSADGTASKPGSASGAAAPPNRTVAYVLTEREEAIYQAKDKDGKETNAECPEGLYEYGVREQFAAKFPQIPDKKWTLAESSLAMEAEIWFPNTTPDKFTFREVKGDISYGVNLDGKVKPSDFTSPDGKPGIDNQFYRAVGCIPSYREGSSQLVFYNEYLEGKQFNRTIIQLTGVDSLENDDEVTVTTYRGLDPLVRDALGNFQVDATQRADLVYGQEFVSTSKAKIVNGVLMTTQSADFVWPNENHTDASTELMHDAHFELKLTPEKMEGVIGGYVDVESAYRAMIKRYGTHQISYGRLAAASLYKVMRRLADGYPDPATNENTAISSALKVAGIRVNLVFPSDLEGKRFNENPSAQVAANGKTGTK
jgi:hypothetical protein